MIGYAPRRNPKNHSSSTDCSSRSNKNGESSVRGGKRSPADATSPNKQGSITGNQRFLPANAINQKTPGFNNMNSRSPADATSPNQQGFITGKQRFPPANAVNQNAQGSNSMDPGVTSSVQFGRSSTRNLSHVEASLAPTSPLRDSPASGSSRPVDDNGQPANNHPIKGVNHLKQNGPDLNVRYAQLTHRFIIF